MKAIHFTLFIVSMSLQTEMMRDEWKFSIVVQIYTIFTIVSMISYFLFFFVPLSL